RTADDVPERGVDARELLDGDAVAELSESLAPQLLGVADAEQPGVAHLRDERARDLILLFDLLRARREDLIDEAADGALHESDVFRKSGIHLSDRPRAG